jgi:hypothetical protein
VVYTSLDRFPRRRFDDALGFGKGVTLDNRYHNVLRFLAFALLAASALSACSLPGIGAATPTATPAQQPSSNVPAGWQVYAGAHYTIAYPPDWSYSFKSPPTGAQGQGIILSGAQTSDQITIMEQYGFSSSDIQKLCKLGEGETMTRLAGLPMKYTLGEGVYRTWFFLNSQGYSYSLTVLDGNQPQAAQKQHDAILATFRPRDSASGCP